MARKTKVVRFRVGPAGINYRPHGRAGAEEVRAESGDIVTDLPPASIGWLVDQGVVEELGDGG